MIYTEKRGVLFFQRWCAQGSVFCGIPISVLFSRDLIPSPLAVPVLLCITDESHFKVGFSFTAFQGEMGSLLYHKLA